MFGNGNKTYFQEPQPGIFVYCEPDGDWIGTEYLPGSQDQVVFLKLPYVGGSAAYVKVMALTIAPEPASVNGTMVSFRYEYQSQDLGLCLFTNQSR